MFKKLVWDNSHGGHPSAEAGFLARYWTLENNDDTWTVWLGSVKCGQIMFKATAATLEEVQKIAEEDFQKRLAEYVDTAVLYEAVTPSGATKAAYSSEFEFPVRVFDEDGEEYTDHETVPWTTIKEIMAAIKARMQHS